ncbi:hypothetical protein [Paraburkholderia sp. GAS32]|uniref:hypothetical protein n=1 Tax=Paraburkholderia sp. GAS32 TaxID=3035129 RepID=UPI003D22A0C2
MKKRYEVKIGKEFPVSELKPVTQSKSVIKFACVLVAIGVYASGAVAVVSGNYTLFDKFTDAVVRETEAITGHSGCNNPKKVKQSESS